MKVGLYGGSFNPPHKGHLHIIKSALKLGFDQIWVIVNPHNPFKLDTPQLPFDTKISQLRQILPTAYRVKIKTFEAKQPTTETYYTLKNLRRKYKHPLSHQFSWIMGSDSLTRMHQWKGHKEILHHHEIIVFPRMSPLEQIHHRKAKVTRFPAQIHFQRTPLIHISSTQIRKNSNFLNLF